MEEGGGYRVGPDGGVAEAQLDEPGGQGHSLGQEYFDMLGKRYQESQVSGNVARKKGQGINYTVREREGGARKVEQTEQGAELLLPVGYSQNGYSKKGNLRHHYTDDYKSIQFSQNSGKLHACAYQAFLFPLPPNAWVRG